MHMKTQSPLARPGNQNALAGDEAATSFIFARCTPTEKALWVRASKRLGMKLAAWLKQTLNERARVPESVAERNLLILKSEWEQLGIQIRKIERVRKS